MSAWLPTGKPSHRLVGPHSRKATCAEPLPQGDGLEHEWKDGESWRMAMGVVTRFYPTARFAVGEVDGEACADLGAGLEAIMEGIPKALLT